MTTAQKTLAKKFFSGIMVFIIFMYVSVFICSIPFGFSLNNSMNGDGISKQLYQVAITTNQKLAELVRFDFGKDPKGRPISLTLLEKLGRSTALLGAGVLLGIVFGVIKGIFDARKGKQRASSLKVLLTIVPMSVPDALNIALLQFFAIWLIKHGIEVFRVAGSGTANHILLPMIAVSILPACYIARVTAMSIESCYSMDYVKTALGKGCNSKRILWNHVMRNAARIVVEGFKDITSMVIGNMIMVEYMFAYPGVTTFLMKSVQTSDKNSIIAAVITIGTIYFLLNIAFRLLKMFAFRSEVEEAI